jgi:hypothetical protein
VVGFEMGLDEEVGVVSVGVDLSLSLLVEVDRDVYQLASVFFFLLHHGLQIQSYVPFLDAVVKS